MDFEQPLLKAKFLKRYKRFFADIEIDGTIQVAHVANTGSLKGCLESGQVCWVSPAKNPERKLKYSLEIVETKDAPSTKIGVNTAHPNQLVKEVLESEDLRGKFKYWSQITEVKPEFKISDKTRFDFGVRFRDQQKWSFIEVKNVTLVENHIARFPDAVTERGQKHLKEMIELMKKGHHCELVFTIQRNDAKSFEPAKDIDPEYSELLETAIKKGLIVRPFIVQVGTDGLYLTNQELTFLGVSR